MCIEGAHPVCVFLKPLLSPNSAFLKPFCEAIAMHFWSPCRAPTLHFWSPFCKVWLFARFSAAVERSGTTGPRSRPRVPRPSGRGGAGGAERRKDSTHRRGARPRRGRRARAPRQQKNSNRGRSPQPLGAGSESRAHTTLCPARRPLVGRARDNGGGRPARRPRLRGQGTGGHRRRGHATASTRTRTE